MKYLIITPIRDEEKYVEITIQSMLSQTILPTKWIFVDDNSVEKKYNNYNVFLYYDFNFE